MHDGRVIQVNENNGVALDTEKGKPVKAWRRADADPCNGEANSIFKLARLAEIGPGMVRKRLRGKAKIQPAPQKHSPVRTFITDGVYLIARKELLSSLRVAIETDRLKAAQVLEVRDDLLAELPAHDDLDFAVSLSLWDATFRDPLALGGPLDKP